MESKVNTNESSKKEGIKTDTHTDTPNENQNCRDKIENLKIDNFSKLEINDSSILSFIEDSLKSQKIKDKDFIKNHLTSLVFDYAKGVDNFLKILKNRLENKKLIFLRHVQAEHNEYNIYHRAKGLEKPKFFDPKVTTEGASQSAEIREFLRNLDFKVEVVFVSPLRRTLQTVGLIKEEILNSSKVIVTELLREEVTNPDTHFGHHLSKMKETFKDMPFLSYEYMSKEHWWSYAEDHEYIHVEHKHLLKPEKKTHFKARLAMFLIWFIFREENCGCLVSHSKVFKTLHFAPEGSKRAKHGGYYLMENLVLIEYIEKFLENNLKKKEKKFEENIETQKYENLEKNQKYEKNQNFQKFEKNYPRGNSESRKSKTDRKKYSDNYYFEASLKK